MTAGIVVCGGRSTRMGRPKAWLPWRGRPMVAHVVGVLHEVVDEVVVVTSAELELPELDARVVVDREPELGPLGGLREGLSAIESDFAFAASTDAPWLTPEVVRHLLSRNRAVAVEAEGFVQTLCAVYPRAAAGVAGELIAEGHMRPLFLLEACDYERVPEAELPEPAAWRGFNTPEAYLTAVRADAPDARASVELLGSARRQAGRARYEPPVGTLGEVLACAEGVALCDGERVARPYLVSLDGRAFTRDLSVPVGPGEAVLVMDASSGG